MVTRNRKFNQIFTTSTRICVTSGMVAIALLGPTAAAAHLSSPAGREVTNTKTDQTVSALETGFVGNPMSSQQWAFAKTSFESAWSVTRGRGVIVAVIDSGVEADHQDLRGSVLPGIDFVSPGGKGDSDPNGHGTHVAGIIAAHLNNALGIAGAAPGVKILPVRVLNASGGGVASNVAKGIIWAANHGARVINLSLGGAKDVAVHKAIQYANNKGAVVIAAGGNDGQTGNAAMYPAAYPDAIAVAAVDSDDVHAPFGNTGRYLDVSAPGVGIVSTWGSSPTAYADASGTSMAAPFVSAEAALIIATNPRVTVARVTQLLEMTATHLGPRMIFGHGLINPAAAVRAARPGPRDQLAMR